MRSSEDFWNEYGEEGLGTTMQRAKRAIERKRRKIEALKRKGLRPTKMRETGLKPKD